MQPQNYRMEPLTRNNDLSHFNCGDIDLNDFLQNDALKNQENWLSVTKLMYVENTLVGFYTITPDILHKGRIDIADKIIDYPYQKYPAVKLARLAVDIHYQNKGYGRKMLAEFFTTARDAIAIEGGRYITVDAKNTARGFYEQYGFIPDLPKTNREIIPMYLNFYTFYNQ